MKFGLEQQGHIPTIEKMIKEFGNSTSSHLWENIGKEIGWDGTTAAYHYIEYLRKKYNVQEEYLKSIEVKKDYNKILADITTDLNHYFRANLLDNEIRVDEFYLQVSKNFIQIAIPSIDEEYMGGNDEDISRIGEKYDIWLKIASETYCK